MQPKLIKDLGIKFPNNTNKSKRRVWLVECPFCKNHFEAVAHSIKSGNTTKCLKCSYTRKPKKHGWSGTRLYEIWGNMKARCSNKNIEAFVNYGGRGIFVCDEWSEFSKFRDWSLANGYKSTLEIDRKDNDGNYEPSNCRWADKLTQNNNTRRLRKDNRTGYRGVKNKGNRYETSVSVNKKRIYIGTFDTSIMAALARDKYIDDNNLISRKNF